MTGQQRARIPYNIEGGSRKVLGLIQPTPREADGSPGWRSWRLTGTDFDFADPLEQFRKAGRAVAFDHRCFFTLCGVSSVSRRSGLRAPGGQRGGRLGRDAGEIRTSTAVPASSWRGPRRAGKPGCVSAGSVGTDLSMCDIAASPSAGGLPARTRGGTGRRSTPTPAPGRMGWC